MLLLTEGENEMYVLLMLKTGVNVIIKLVTLFACTVCMYHYDVFP